MLKQRQAAAVLLTALFVLMAASCGPKTTVGKNRVILASFYPVYIMTRNVAAGVPGTEVRYLAPLNTGCLHDYSMTPADRLMLEKAEVFVINGLGMEAFLEKAVSQNPGLRVVNSSAGITPLVDRNTGITNPHVWVSVTRAERQVKNIAGGLALLDKAHERLYRKNADTYVRKLKTLAEKMHRGLSGIHKREIITFHEAFPYFADEFGLTIAAVVEREPGSEPSAGEMADIVRLIRNKKAAAIFAEPQYAPKSAITISRETGIPFYTLDPAVTGPDDSDSYIRIMETNLVILEEALK